MPVRNCLLISVTLSHARQLTSLGDGDAGMLGLEAYGLKDFRVEGLWVLGFRVFRSTT